MDPPLVDNALADLYMDPNSSDLDPGSHVEPELSTAAVDGGGSADASILLLPGLDAEEPPQFQPQAFNTK
ncbi:unnamed protein product [Urochloa humidicola]